MKLKISNQIDLRTFAWRLRGLGFLIQHHEADAVPTAAELYGIGELIIEHALAIEELAEDQEREKAK